MNDSTIFLYALFVVAWSLAWYGKAAYFSEFRLPCDGTTFSALLPTQRVGTCLKNAYHINLFQITMIGECRVLMYKRCSQ